MENMNQMKKIGEKNINDYRKKEEKKIISVDRKVGEKKITEAP